MPLKISIITVNLNNANGLKQTIESVLAQTYSSVDYIIIDGGSSDESVDEIKKSQTKIAYWVSEKDKGIYDAMNKGIKVAKGDYLLFLNSGDTLCTPDILEKIFEKGRTADIVYGDINYIYDGGIKKRYRSLHGEKLTMAHFFKDTIAHPAAFIKRGLLENSPYDASLKIVADNKFFYQQVVFNNCSVDYVDLVVSDFDTTGVSSQKENWRKTNEERARVLNNLLPPRIRKDYDMLFLMLDSPLLKYMPLLNKTTGFHSLVAKVVGAMVAVYGFLFARKIKRIS